MPHDEQKAAKKPPHGGLDGRFVGDRRQSLIPAAKGHDDRWVEIHPVLIKELKALMPKCPRGFDVTKANLRVFGFADRSSPRKGWEKACKAAGIEVLTFHGAGRHGFGQEMNVSQKIDEKAAGAFGGWSDISLMKRTYTHAEDTSKKIHGAQQRGIRKAQKTTGLKLSDD